MLRLPQITRVSKLKQWRLFLNNFCSQIRQNWDTLMILRFSTSSYIVSMTQLEKEKFSLRLARNLIELIFLIKVDNLLVNCTSRSQIQEQPKPNRQSKHFNLLGPNQLPTFSNNFAQCLTVIFLANLSFWALLVVRKCL